MRNISQLRIINKAPVGWKICNLGAVIENTQYGTSNATSENGKIPVIGMKNIQDGRVTQNNLEKTNLSETEYQSLVLRRGDILINRTNSYELVGKTGIYDSDMSAVFASYLVRLKPDLNQVNPKYLNYWLNSPQIKKVIKKIATKAVSQANINPTELQRFCPLLLPPLSHQEKIVSLLQEIDLVIQKTERLIDLKSRKYWIRINTILETCSRYSVPLETFVLHKTKGSSVVKKEAGKYPYIGAVSFRGKYLEFTDDEHALKCEKNDILLLWDGENAGNSTTGHSGVVASTVMKLTLNSNIDNYFLQSQLSKDNTRIRSICEGSGIPHIPGDFLRWYKVKVTDLNTQKYIGSLYRTFEREINYTKDLLKKYLILKKFAMQRILSGCL